MPAPLLLFSCPSMQRSTRHGVGLLEVAQDQSGQIWDWILALPLSLSLWSLAIIGLLGSSVLPSGRWGYNILNHSSLLCESDEVSLWRCWKLGADLRYLREEGCLEERTFSAKSGKTGWLVILLRAVHSAHIPLKDPTQLKQLPQWVMELSPQLKEIFFCLFLCGLIALSLFNQWTLNFGKLELLTILLSVPSISQGVAWNFKQKYENI